MPCQAFCRQRHTEIDAVNLHPADQPPVTPSTGTFTSEARKESVREGVPPIELVDGQKLVEMMESLEFALTPVRSYEVDTKFFLESQQGKCPLLYSTRALVWVH